MNFEGTRLDELLDEVLGPSRVRLAQTSIPPRRSFQRPWFSCPAARGGRPCGHTTQTFSLSPDRDFLSCHDSFCQLCPLASSCGRCVGAGR